MSQHLTREQRYIVAAAWLAWGVYLLIALGLPLVALDRAGGHGIVAFSLGPTPLLPAIILLSLYVAGPPAIVTAAVILYSRIGKRGAAGEQ
jgi:hypothetical protein